MAMDRDDFINKANAIRNKLIEINREAKALAEEGKSVKGCFDITDFDGDVEETADNIGDAYEQTNELDGVISAMHHFLSPYQD